MSSSSLIDISKALETTIKTSTTAGGEGEEGESEEVSISLTLDEYYVLIDYCVESLEMRDLLEEYGLPPGMEGLNKLR